MKYLLTVVMLVLAVSCQTTGSFATPASLPSGSAASAQAQAGAPVAAQTTVVAVPADNSVPTFTVTVEPFTVAAQDLVSGGGVIDRAPEHSFWLSSRWNEFNNVVPKSLSPTAPLADRIGYGLSAQLLSGLSNVGNLVVIDHQAYLANPDQYPEIFVIKGVVTEFSETAELNDQQSGFTTMPAGMIAQDIGNLIGSPIVKAIGSVAIHTDANRKTTATTRKGMVGLDLQIVQPKSGRIAGAFPCQGTFVTQNVTKINNALGKTESSAAYAASALGQAQRQALNNAVVSIWDTLKRQKISVAEAPR